MVIQPEALCVHNTPLQANVRVKRADKVNEARCSAGSMAGPLYTSASPPFPEVPLKLGKSRRWGRVAKKARAKNLGRGRLAESDNKVTMFCGSESLTHAFGVDRNIAAARRPMACRLDL